MKKNILIVFLSAPFYFFSQKNESESNTSKYFQIGVNYSNDACYRSLVNNDGSNTSMIIIQQNDGYDLIKYGYTTGINGNYNFHENFSAEIGIQYSNKGYRTKPVLSYIPDPTQNQSIRARYIFNYHYIDVPVKINMTLGKRKLKFISSLGFSTNFLIKKTETVLKFDSQNKKDRETLSKDFIANRINISPFLSLGLDYKLSDKINLRLEPIFRYGVIKLTNTPITERLFNLGLNVGCYYKI